MGFGSSSGFGLLLKCSRCPKNKATTVCRRRKTHTMRPKPMAHAVIMYSLGLVGDKASSYGPS